MVKRWYVVDHARFDRKIRGPYEHAETASAVRREIERHDDDANLWIVSEPDEGSASPVRETIRQVVAGRGGYGHTEGGVWIAFDGIYEPALRVDDLTDAILAALQDR